MAIRRCHRTNKNDLLEIRKANLKSVNLKKKLKLLLHLKIKKNYAAEDMKQ